MINYLVFGITYSFACVVQPGPFQAFLLSQSLTRGWRKTLPLVFAPLLSDVPVILLVLFALTKIPPEVMTILQCLGGVFLLFLAWNAFKSWRQFRPGEKQTAFPQKNFFKAVIINLLNPGPYLGWSLVMGPWLIRGLQEGPVHATVLLAGFYGSMLLYSMIMVVLFASAGNLGPRVHRISIAISAAVLVLFGAYQLWAGIAMLF